MVEYTLHQHKAEKAEFPKLNFNEVVKSLEEVETHAYFAQFLTLIGAFRHDLRNLAEFVKLKKKEGSSAVDYFEEIKGFLQNSERIIMERAARNPNINRHYKELIGKALHKEFTSLKCDSENPCESILPIFESIDILLWGFERIVEEYDFVGCIERNIKHRIVSIYGQGIFNAENGREETEILARMHNSAGIVLSPAAFMGIVNEMTVYDPTIIRNFERVEKFDDVVIQNSFAYIAELLASESEDAPTFSININPISLYDPAFVDIVEGHVQKYSIDPKRIVIEILEYTKIDNPELVNASLIRLRKMGFRIAIDDYPEGNNTLRQITTLQHFDIIKLDGMFVMNTFRTCIDCGERTTCMNLISSSLDNDTFCVKRIGEKHDLETLIFSLRFLKILYPHIRIFAERIENMEVFEFLRFTGLIDAYQGYAFEKPKLLCSGHSGTEMNITQIRNRAMDIVTQKQTMKVFDAELDDKNLATSLLGVIKKNLRWEVEAGFSKKMITAMSGMLQIIGLDTFRVYIQKGSIDEKIVNVAEIHADRSVSFDSFIFDKKLNRIPKKYTNYFKIRHGKEDWELGDVSISESGVISDGDDMAIKVSEKYIVGFDDASISKCVFTEKQRVLMLEIALSLSDVSS